MTRIIYEYRLKRKIIERKKKKKSRDKPNNALINSRIIIHSEKTILTESKGKYPRVTKKNNLRDISSIQYIAHLVAENNEMKSELQILRRPTKKVTVIFIGEKNNARK